MDDMQMDIYEQQIMAMIHAVDAEDSDTVAFAFFKGKLMEALLWLDQCAGECTCDNTDNKH